MAARKYPIAGWNRGILISLWLALLIPAQAVTLTVKTNILGGTPDLLAYNCGHFSPNSNTRDWWRYSGVSGARIFISANDIEPNDDLAPWGDGVNSQASFTNRQALLRANPNSTTYINWPYLTNRYENVPLNGGNEIRVNYACRELRKLGIQITINITANESTFPIASASDWAGKWELWQHFYFQAFYLGRNFDAQRFQMYNEPDAVATLTDADWLLRLKLASDAVQSAIADVNALYGKSLVPMILAPVNAGTADSDFAGGAGSQLGGVAVSNRHVNFLGQTDASFSLIQKYDYHQYGATANGFGSDLASLNNLLTAAMSPEPRLSTTISEFNTHTAATFDTLPDTLDNTTEYPELGDIAVSLVKNFCSELYLFKFHQTIGSATGLPVKNGVHFADNNNTPFNTGGITKAGEVWRLFNKACAPGRARLDYTGSGTLDVIATFDPATKNYYIFSVNNTASAVAITSALAAWNIQAGNVVLIEEVSETSYGAGKIWTKIVAGGTVTGTQPARSAWLFTIPSLPQNPELTISASDDAQVTDGTNKGVRYGTNTSMTVRNDPASTARRSAALMKFSLPAIVHSNVQFAVLSLTAATVTNLATVQAHVYGLDGNNWSQPAVTWSNAPNLKQNVTAGNTISKDVILDAGGTAHILGQLVVNNTALTEKYIDVTDFIRAGTNTTFSFLIVQDPRWDTNQLHNVAGDTQGDGIRIISNEGSAANTSTPGPRLRLVLATAGSNSPPVAVNDSYTTAEDTPLIVPAPGVLTNDFDADTNALTASVVTFPTNGSLALNGDGSFNYTPALNRNGPDSFTYKVSDGQAESAAATVSLNVTPVSDPPIAVNDSATTGQDTPVVVTPLANDSDPDGGTLAIVAFTQGAHGSVSNSGGATLTYTPANGFSGNDSFGYTIGNGPGGTNSAIVSVNVDAANTYSAWTNLTVANEAFIRGGANAGTDQDEAALGYVMVKYVGPPYDNARKAYFQFALGPLVVSTGTSAVFTVHFTAGNQQRVQLWGLNQAYPDFSSALTWNAAQANDTNSNDLLATGAATAGMIGEPVLIPLTGTTPYDFTVTNLENFVHGGRVTLALSGLNDAANHTSGLRLQRTNATLQLLATLPLPVTNPPVVTGIAVDSNGIVTVNFQGTANRTHWVQARTNCFLGNWETASTNFSDANGAWSFTDAGLSGEMQRFYRAVMP